MTSQTRSPFLPPPHPFVAFRPFYALTKPRVVQLIVLRLDRHGAGGAGLPTWRDVRLALPALRIWLAAGAAVFTSVWSSSTSMPASPHRPGGPRRAVSPATPGPLLFSRLVRSRVAMLYVWSTTPCG
jgi:hypothetical protein